MKPAVRNEFHQWYRTQHGHRFNFMEEIIKYCRQDVLVLKQVGNDAAMTGLAGYFQISHDDLHTISH